MRLLFFIGYHVLITVDEGVVPVFVRALRCSQPISLRGVTSRPAGLEGRSMTHPVNRNEPCVKAAWSFRLWPIAHPLQLLAGDSRAQIEYLKEVFRGSFPNERIGGLQVWAELERYLVAVIEVLSVVCEECCGSPDEHIGVMAGHAKALLQYLPAKIWVAGERDQIHPVFPIIRRTLYEIIAKAWVIADDEMAIDLLCCLVDEMTCDDQTRMVLDRLRKVDCIMIARRLQNAIATIYGICADAGSKDEIIRQLCIALVKSKDIATGELVTRLTANNK